MKRHLLKNRKAYITDTERNSGMTIRILKGGSPEYACYPLEKSVGPPEDVIKRHPD